MLNVLYLPREENNLLMSELRYEYIQDNYLSFLKLLVSDLIDERYITQICTDELYSKLGVNMMYTLDKIILNDVYRYVSEGQLNNILCLIQNKQYSKNLYIFPRYIGEIIREVFNIDEMSVDYISIENIFIKKINYYIDRIYCSNNDKFNDIILKLVEMFYTHCSSMNVRSCRFELAPGNRPVMLFSR